MVTGCTECQDESRCTGSRELTGKPVQSIRKSRAPPSQNGTEALQILSLCRLLSDFGFHELSTVCQQRAESRFVSPIFSAEVILTCQARYQARYYSIQYQGCPRISVFTLAGSFSTLLERYFLATQQYWPSFITSNQ